MVGKTRVIDRDADERQAARSETKLLAQLSCRHLIWAPVDIAEPFDRF